MSLAQLRSRWSAILDNPLVRCRQGNVAVLVGLAIIPLIAAGGLAIDYTRALQFKTSLQGAVDSAALAGASELSSSTTTAKTMATTYIAAEISKLPPNNGVSYTVTVPNSSSVVVSATGQMKTTFMAMFTSSFPVTTAATAGPAAGPGGTTTLNVNFGGFNSSAADANTIYFYIVPSDNSVPADSALTPLYTNNPNAPVTPPSSITIGTNQKIGFALFNVTGGLYNYGSNQWGGTPGTQHKFYSHLNPPSSVAYPGNGQNNLKACTSGSQSTCIASGPVSTATTGAPTCAGLGNSTEIMAWNDMGGNPDDLDYNDAVYNVSCGGGGGGGNNGNNGNSSGGIVLLK